MKGLLVKDCMIIRSQARTLVLLLICGLFMAYTFDAQTFTAYVTLLGATLVLGTMSYDEMDNSMQYLLVLPVKRETYAKEKYVFIGGFVLAASLIAVLVAVLLAGQGVLKGNAEEILSSWAGMLFTAGIMIALMIPFQLKYGREKGRLVLYFVFAVVAFIAMFLSRSGILSNVDFSVLKQIPVWAGAVGVCVFFLLALFVSEKMSEKIIREKEF